MNISFIKEYGISISQAVVTSAAFVSNNSGASLITGLGATVLGSYGAIQSASKIWNGKRDVKEACHLALSLVVGTIGVYQLYSIQQQLNDVSQEKNNLELQILENKELKESTEAQIQQLLASKRELQDKVVEAQKTSIKISQKLGNCLETSKFNLQIVEQIFEELEEDQVDGDAQKSVIEIASSKS